MKNTILTFFLLFLGIQSFAQVFKISDLEKFNQMEMSDFQKEMKAQKYQFYDTTKSDDFELYEYDSEDYKFKISKFEYTEDKSQDRIEFSFKSKLDYENYQKTILELGYKATDSGKTSTGETYIDYTKNDLKISLFSPKVEKNVVNAYTILVFKEAK